ncbi:hypothetical protein B5C26_13220 [Photorhabdus luminescens]|uniref:hypothetical protein n=1 Tax=Photorhabdus luminescens TaxID=29488 RepID=UPI000B4D4700|nr:hypothetical protein [Photorhabdus luminescens]OWO81604.1 hypothetical protein B5C26_13220 [Photorhabdus luminescens]
MTILNESWKPEFGTIFTWFAMDKNGRIAVMVNNCFGDLPKKILSISDAESLLDQLTEYMWEESLHFTHYPQNKNGYFSVDLYSSWRNRDNLSKTDIFENLKNSLVESGHYSETNLPVNKGFFVYHGVEGSYEGEDYPIGYDGETKMGDYFRYLMPTIYASIDDLPKELHRGIAVSDTVDFTVDRLLDNDLINTYFTRMYSE